MNSPKRPSIRERALKQLEAVPEIAFDPAQDRKRQTLGPTRAVRQYVEDSPVLFVRKEAIANLRFRPGYERDESEYRNAEFEALKDSIAEDGINTTPIDVREVISTDGAYMEILAGERRTRALQALGLPSALVAVRDCDDKTADRIHELENRHRVGKAAYSRAVQYKRMLDSGKYETQAELAANVRIPKSDMSRFIALVESAPKGMWERVTDPANVSARDARVLLRAYEKEPFAKAVKGRAGWSASELMAIARDVLKRPVPEQKDKVIERKRGKRFFIQLPLSLSAAERGKVLELVRDFVEKRP